MLGETPFVNNGQSDQKQFEFAPSVSTQMREAAETLFFFNPHQGRLIRPIREAVERYGAPRIIESDGRVRISVPAWDMQCLFACDREIVPSRLAGVVLFLRTEPERMAITHLALDQDYAEGGEHESARVGFQLIEQVRAIARRIKGITHLDLPYRKASLKVTNRAR